MSDVVGQAFSLFQAAAAEGVLELDGLPALAGIFRDGVWAWVNPALARALGYAPAELLGRPIAETLHASTLERFVTLARGAHAEVRLLKKGGGELVTDAARLQGLQYDGRPAEGFFAVDATVARATDERLFKSEETVRALVGQLPDLVIRMSADGTVHDVLGGPALHAAEVVRSIVGRKVWELWGGIPSLDASLMAMGKSTLHAVLKERTPQRREFPVVVPDGERYFEVRVLPLDSPDELMVLARDVTEKKHEERQLQIAERMASLGTLAAGVAHEINNPLTFVMSNTDVVTEAVEALLAGQPVDAVELRACLADIRDGCRRVRDIVQTLRAFSRVEPGPSHPVDVEKVLEGALAMTARELKQRGAAVERRFSGAPQVLGDETRLTQVFVNLLVNAAQALPERGAGNRVELTTASEGELVRVDVRDTGAGIAPEALPRVFDPFFTTKPGVGTGLGLSIVHRAVRELSGRVQVQSRPGAGSVFSVLRRQR